MSTPFHDSASYNAVCDERDAIAKDNDKAHALLRQALDALNHVNVQDRVQIIAALRARVHH